MPKAEILQIGALRDDATFQGCIFGWEFGQWDEQQHGWPIKTDANGHTTFYGWTFAELHEVQIRAGTAKEAVIFMPPPTGNAASDTANLTALITAGGTPERFRHS